MTTSTSGSYTFRSSSLMNSYGCLYQTSFDPSIPSQNLIACDDDSGGGTQFLITRSLLSGGTYVFGCHYICYRCHWKLLSYSSGSGIGIYDVNHTVHLLSNVTTTWVLIIHVNLFWDLKRIQRYWFEPSWGRELWVWPFLKGIEMCPIDILY